MEAEVYIHNPKKFTRLEMDADRVNLIAGFSFDETMQQYSLVSLTDTTIDLISDSITLTADKVYINGTTTFDSLFTDGTTTIDGGKITTGTITADELNVSTLSAISSNLGNITGGSINIGNGTFTVDSDGSVTASDGTIGGANIGSESLTYEYDGSTSSLVGLYGGTSPRLISTVTYTENGDEIEETTSISDGYVGTYRRINDSTDKYITITSDAITSNGFTYNNSTHKIELFDSTSHVYLYGSSGNIEATGDLSIGGESDIDGDLTVGGSTTFGGSVSIVDNTLRVTGSNSSITALTIVPTVTGYGYLGTSSLKFQECNAITLNSTYLNTDVINGKQLGTNDNVMFMSDYDTLKPTMVFNAVGSNSARTTTLSSSSYANYGYMNIWNTISTQDTSCVTLTNATRISIYESGLYYVRANVCLINSGSVIRVKRAKITLNGSDVLTNGTRVDYATSSSTTGLWDNIIVEGFITLDSSPKYIEIYVQDESGSGSFYVSELQIVKF